MSAEISSEIFSAFYNLLALPEENLCQIGVTQPVPRIPSAQLSALCYESTKILSKQPINMEISGPVYVVGDLHGNMIDLIRVFKQTTHNNYSYVFLGDYVDRGQFSIEVITLLLAFFIKNKDRVILLRGNHESSEVNKVYGFYDQIVRYYKEDSPLWTQFNNVFAYLPITCLINNRLFCIHGGIAPELKLLEQINNMQKPIYCIEKGSLLYTVLWSDPHHSDGFIDSLRARSCSYGHDVLSNFLKINNLKMILRGHQCVHSGIEQFHHGKGMTVFSSSNYSSSMNDAGYILIDADDKIDVFSLPLINSESLTKINYFKPVARSSPLVQRHIFLSSSNSQSMKFNLAFPRYVDSPRIKMDARKKSVRNRPVCRTPNPKQMCDLEMISTRSIISVAESY